MKRKSMMLAVTATGILAGAAAGSPAAHAADVPPAPALKPLSMFSGTWNCSVVTTGPDGSRTELTSKANVGFIYNGHFQRWQEESFYAGFPAGSAEYIWGWNARRHRFTVDIFYSSGLRTVQTTRGWVGNSMTTKGTTSQPDGRSYPSTIKLTRTSESAFVATAVLWVNGRKGPVLKADSSCTR